MLTDKAISKLHKIEFRSGIDANPGDIVEYNGNKFAIISSLPISSGLWHMIAVSKTNGDYGYSESDEPGVYVSKSNHNHDGRYYTETESDARFLGISAKASNSDKLDGIDSTGFILNDLPALRDNLNTAKINELAPKNSTAQNLTQNAWTKLTNYTNTTNIINGKFTASHNGRFQMSGSFQFRTPTTGQNGLRMLAIYKNGSYLRRVDWHRSGGNSAWDRENLQLPAMVLDLNSGDYIEIYAYTQLTSDQNYYYSTDKASWINVVEL